MSPFTAWCLVLLAPALAFLDRPRFGWFVLICAVQVAAIGGVSAVASLWNASAPARDGWLPPVALHTAVVLAALGAGIIARQRAVSSTAAPAPRRTGEAAVNAFFWAMVLLLLAATSFTYRSNLHFAAAAQELDRVQQARIELAELRACVHTEPRRDCRGQLDRLARSFEGEERRLLDRLRGTLEDPTRAEAQVEVSTAPLDWQLRALLLAREAALARDRSAMLVSLLLTLALCVLIVTVLSRNVRTQLRRSAGAREEVQRQQALLQAVLESSPDLLAYRDANGVFLGCNDAYVALAGMPAQAVAGRAVEEVLAPAVAQQVREDDAKVLQANRGFSS
jgi:PAS domain-containing protein